MRVLIVTNFYPPFFIGGYELACAQIAEALRERGHDVRILTSTRGYPKPVIEEDIYRWLRVNANLVGEAPGVDASPLEVLKLFIVELRNRNALLRLVRKFLPDIIYLWNLQKMPLSLFAYAEATGVATCCYLFDEWYTVWDKHDPWTLLFRIHWGFRGRLQCALLKIGSALAGLFTPPIKRRVTKMQFGSRFLQQSASKAGRDVAGSTVLYWGLPLERYAYRSDARAARRLLYVGQVMPHKGVHSIIEALSILKSNYACRDLELTIVGVSHLPSYEAEIRSSVSRHGFEESVRFDGLVEPQHLPLIYREHDIFVFSSIWQEPFGLVLLEAMAAGLAVVGTGTGGSVEILEDGYNALLFRPDDAQQCASQILRLLENVDLYETIRSNGRKTVETKFDFRRTAIEVEAQLQRIATSDGQALASVAD